MATKPTCVLEIPDGSIPNAALSPDPGHEIAVEKQHHLHKWTERFGFKSDQQPTGTVRVPVHRARAAGVVRVPAGLLIDTGTSTSIAFRLYKNGSNICTTDAVVTHSTSDRSGVSAVLSSSAYVSGDVFEAEMIVTSNTGALGPCMDLEFDEKASAT